MRKNANRGSWLLGAALAASISLGLVGAYGASASTGSGGGSGVAALKSIGPAKATGKTVSLAKGPQGIYLIGPNGRALYVYAKDHGTTSGCHGACAANWPALVDSGAITSGPVINKAKLSKAHGQKADQITYYGHLLYYFAGDSAPGQTNGVGLPGWHLLGPFGNVMLPRS